MRALGFDERFIRMWDLYLAYCEAAFLERHAGVFQMLLVKNGARREQFNEPWSDIARQTRRRRAEPHWAYDARTIEEDMPCELSSQAPPDSLAVR